MQMDTRVRSRRYVLIVFVLVLFVSGIGVAALAQSDAGDVYTGCLNQNSGVLHNVAVGFEPVKTCNGAEIQITWDRAGPAFDERLTALEERVAQQTVGAPSPVSLFAAATVDVTTIENSVGPIESVIQVGAAHYRVDFGEDVFGDIAPRSMAFISLASNSAYSNPSPCTYEVYAADKLDILCWDETTGQPEDAEWSLMVYSANTATPTP
jgi:hypothetical protein